MIFSFGYAGSLFFYYICWLYGIVHRSIKELKKYVFTKVAIKVR